MLYVLVGIGQQIYCPLPDRLALGAYSFPLTIFPCWSTPCMCMVLNFVAWPSSDYLGMCGGVKKIASSVELSSTFHFLKFVFTFLLFCCWFWLLLYCKCSASDGQVITGLYFSLGMIVLSMYECPASLGSETILCEALVLFDTPQCQSRRPHSELSYSISVARGTTAACRIGGGHQIHFHAACWVAARPCIS